MAQRTVEMMRPLILALLQVNLILGAVDNGSEDEAVAFLQRAAKLIGEDETSFFPGAWLQHLPFTADGKRLEWVGASWRAPEAGALFVVSDGAPVAAWEAGAIMSLKSGAPLAGVGSTAKVVFQPTVGTGYRLHQTAIVAFVAGRIEVLWQHDVLENVAVLPHEPETEKTHQTAFSADDTKVLVTGQITTFTCHMKPVNPDVCKVTRELPSESYCWAATRRRYVPCSE